MKYSKEEIRKSMLLYGSNRPDVVKGRQKN